MSTPLLIGLIALLLVLTVLWVMARARRIRAAAEQREADALARMRTGDSPTSVEGETIFEAAGVSSRIPERRGLEVAELDEVVDLEALLAGEPQGVAHRARATLEEPTNISMDLDTLPPRPVAPAPAAPSAAALPPPPARSAPVQTPIHGVAKSHAPAAAAAAPAARPAARPSQPSPPTLVARLPDLPERAPLAAAKPAPRPVQPAAPALSGGSTIRRGNDDVPLKELTLAWFEARGYRSSPASAAVRPIEQVLRHRHDPARAYAFVEENERVTADRVQRLRTQARSIGLLRVLIVANAGADEGAATKSKGVRVMDRAGLAAEFDQLDFSVAAKIIAVARKRSGAPITLP